MRTEIAVKVSADFNYLIVESNVRRIDMGMAWMKYNIQEWLKKSHSLIFQIVKFELRTEVYTNKVNKQSIVEIQRILKQEDYIVANLKLDKDQSRVRFVILLKLTAEQKKRRRQQLEVRW
jgi:hypothetical protein